MNSHELPRDNVSLTSRFLSAACPSVEEFDGIYTVERLTGLWLPPNVKDISNGAGVNRLFGRIEWGHFALKYGITSEMLRAVVFDYATRRNVLTGGIRDYVRRLDDGTYLGAFNYVVLGKPRFVGYFKLKQVLWRDDLLIEGAGGKCYIKTRS